MELNYMPAPENFTKVFEGGTNLNGRHFSRLQFPHVYHIYKFLVSTSLPSPGKSDFPEHSLSTKLNTITIDKVLSFLQFSLNSFSSYCKQLLLTY